MDETPNLELPYIMPSQAQKHVTHNEAIRMLDAVVQLSVEDRDLSAAPGSPTDGDRYIVKAAGSGSWSGKDNLIAAYQDNAWNFYQPVEGWLCWVVDEDKLLAWDGSNWSEVSGGAVSVNPTPLVGINATADTTNRLSLNSPASLFNHEGNGHQQIINKNASADTASQLYQTGFSGRAETGLTGDDDFHFKVSPNGSEWYEALNIDRNNGLVSFPSGMLDNNSQDANLLANGDFQVWQRGDSLANTHPKYSTDRWKSGSQSGTISVTISKEAASTGSGNAVRLTRPVGDSTTGKTISITQINEGVDVERALAIGAVTLSFYARKGAGFSKPDINALVQTTNDPDNTTWSKGQLSSPIGNSVAQLSALTTAWQKFTLTLSSVPSDTKRMAVCFQYTPTGTAVADDYFELERIRLEVGTVAGDFKPRSPHQELARCRYTFRRLATVQDVNDLSYVMRAIPTETGAGPYDYDAEMG